MPFRCLSDADKKLLNGAKLSSLLKVSDFTLRGRHSAWINSPGKLFKYIIGLLILVFRVHAKASV
jgi:hypothetical protein